MNIEQHVHEAEFTGGVRATHGLGGPVRYQVLGTRIPYQEEELCHEELESH